MITNRFVWFGLAMLFLAALALPSHTLADDDGDDDRALIVEPGGELFGKSYNELAGEWWNWALKEPAATNVVLDPDGRFCDLNQEGKVWFLAGTFGGEVKRKCVIPPGKAIFFPTLNGLSFAPDFPVEGDDCLGFGSTVDDVRCDINDDLAVAPAVVLSANIDGEPVSDLFAYRAQTEPGGFTLEIPEGSILTQFEDPFDPGDRFPAVADGYWILLRPLSSGLHKIDFRAEGDFGGSPIGAKYKLFILGDDDDDDDDDD